MRRGGVRGDRATNARFAPMADIKQPRRTCRSGRVPHCSSALENARFTKESGVRGAGLSCHIYHFLGAGRGRRSRRCRCRGEARCGGGCQGSQGRSRRSRFRGRGHSRGGRQCRPGSPANHVDLAHRQIAQSSFINFKHAVLQCTLGFPNYNRKGRRTQEAIVFKRRQNTSLAKRL